MNNDQKRKIQELDGLFNQPSKQLELCIDWIVAQAKPVVEDSLHIIGHIGNIDLDKCPFNYATIAKACAVISKESNLLRIKHEPPTENHSWISISSKELAWYEKDSDS